MTEQYSKEYLAALRPIPPCVRCQCARATTEPADVPQSPICGWCAVREFIDDPAWRRHRPWTIVRPAQTLIEHNDDRQLIEWFQLSRQAAAGLRLRIMAQLAEPDYDGMKDGKASYDLAIDEMRKRKEAAE